MTDDFYERPGGWAMVTIGWIAVSLTGANTGATGMSVLGAVVALWCCRRWALSRSRTL
jgi:hypothetical protein